MGNIQVETTTLSSRGQIVLPQDVREKLKLGEGDKFLVMAEGDTVLLKAIKPISKDIFAGMLKTTRDAVRKAGLLPKDLESAITKVRNASRS
jgi:AbrB family looped-hinge helix DNA binding protein